jgi:hypothetical protein
MPLEAAWLLPSAWILRLRNATTWPEYSFRNHPDGARDLGLLTPSQPTFGHGGPARIDEEATMPEHQDRQRPVFSQPPVEGTDERLET